MEVTGKSKIGEAGRKAHIARADALASQLPPIVAELRGGGITSWYGIAIALNKRGVGIWEQKQVQRVMERARAIASMTTAGCSSLLEGAQTRGDECSATAATRMTM
jgi:hypothetical protein